MPKGRPSAPRGEAKRDLLLDAAERVMIDKGYAGVTSRSVGLAAGAPAPLVHYYFPSLDDLFVALLQRGVARSKERFREAMDSPDPLRSVWEMSLDPRGTAFLMEITALSNHREAVRDALVEISSEFHTMQVAGFAELFERLGVDTERFPPELAVIAIGGISRMVVRERAMGTTVGQDVALQAIDKFIAALSSASSEAPSTSAKRASRNGRATRVQR
jgi:AcrR family transcriptional regulator